VDELALPAPYAELGVLESTRDVVVYRARRDGRQLVVAVTRGRGGDDDARFREHARKVDAALAGPGHVPIADVVIGRGVRAVVRPWVEGTAWELRRRPLLDALALLDPIARALGRAHRLGHAHSALTPERLVVGADGAVIVDLTTAALMPLSQTRTYSAPEQLEPRPNVSPAATDVHALALLFIATVAGSPPYGSALGHDLYARVMDRRARPSLHAHGVEAAPTIERVLERALSVDPEIRFADADTFWDALRTAVFAAPETSGEPPRPRPIESRPPPPNKPPRASLPIVIGGSVAIVAVLFGAEAVWRAAKRPAAPIVASAAPSTSTVVATSTSVAPSVTASATPPPPPPADMVAVDEHLFVDRTEVPVGKYRECVTAGKCAETYKRGTGYSESDPVRREWICNLHRKNRDDHPVNCINFGQATAYCEYAGKRLPTGDEWTRAARGAGPRKYPWGDATPRCREVVFARYGPDNPGCNKQPVGTAPVEAHPKSASPAGALDMAGSLWEWTTDRSPRGLPILRGGSWDSGETGVTIESRLEQSPGNGDVTLGFRCVRDAQ
jgi:hypothetical protein